VRLGGPVFAHFDDPNEWAAALRKIGYRAACCPVKADAGKEVVSAYSLAAAQADIVIAEVGAWSNPLSPDENESRKAVIFCQRQLALADEIGAVCCVNIAGSLSTVWDGPHPGNLTDETFERIVIEVREIIDAVKPVRAYYTLEPMPFLYPDSPDSYLDLIRAVDRERFAAHLDPVNMISSPQRFYKNAAFVRECFEKLGPWIKSVHAKDIVLGERLTTHLDEVRPGKGFMDYHTLLRAMNQLNPDTPLMLEHLQLEEEYIQSAEYIRSAAAQIGVMV